MSNALLIPPAQFNTGFYVSGLTAPIGVAVAVGNLIGLNEQQLAWAMGLAASQSSGFRGTHGTMTAHFRPGHATKAGVWAALLAAKNFDGPEDALEGSKGFFDVFTSKANLAFAIDGLGTEFELLNNSYKPYPCGIVIHPAIDACLAIRTDANAEGAPAKVTIRANPLALKLTGVRSPKTPLESHVSIYHWVATALLLGKAGIAETKPACLFDPRIQKLRDMVEIVADDSIGQGQAHADVTYESGHSFAAYIQFARGSANRPMSDEEIDQKFTAQAEPVLGSAQAAELRNLARNVIHLEEVGCRIAEMACPQR
ncbi:MmgE/PrpD family protein [Bosea sp. (in: a-proteobacteria)]|uniref:MmgE/PrpD family protein n=1 Tax=Bosea sp. (in: a-proteobacteria) TaxID=1871050 RepID=UPI00260F7177|nr:MmgE/PrpD family protein [Bosea sp. (in: a-proteobacteria)]MCO5090032.1 MmgE/PrpD family protein [Bosea sp. (in: a-proteobacteria)]